MLGRWDLDWIKKLEWAHKYGSGKYESGLDFFGWAEYIVNLDPRVQLDDRTGLTQGPS